MSLEVIGQKLKAAREAQGLSLRQIYERTKIPINHLQSIDGGMSDDLPEPVYVAGFIKRYAECIGLDGQVLVEEYRKVNEPPANGNGKHAPKLAPAQPIYSSSDYMKASRIDTRPPVYKMLPFNIFLAGVFIIGLLWMLSSNSQKLQDPSLLSLKESASRYQTTTTTDVQMPTANGTVTPPKNDGRVSLSASQHVWVEVKAVSNGESLFTGYLEQGDRRDFDDSQGLRIRAGNGGALSVEFKGKIETFGSSGKVAERTFLTQSETATAATTPTDEAKTASSTASTTTTAAATTPPKPRKPRKTDESRQASGLRRLDEVPSRTYIPGESLGGGTRSIDVPYRYSEGRLDAN